MSRTFAYCRVSTAPSGAGAQVEEIKAAGFAIEPGRVFSETVAGYVPASERKAFRRLLGELEAEDVLVVTKLDQLGNSVMDFRTTVEGLAASGVRVHCIALGGGDLTSPAGKVTMGVIAAVAVFDRDLFVERTQSGRERARAEGKPFGRKPVLTPEEQAAICARRKKGDSLGKLAKEYAVNRSTIQRVEKRAARGLPAPAPISTPHTRGSVSRRE